MDVNMEKLKKELEILVQRATSPTSDDDILAYEGIKSLILKDAALMNEFKQKLQRKISSNTVKEVLKTFDLLDECMFNCGSEFRREIGQFRFLNDILKLILPNHKGKETPEEIRNKILHLFYVWRIQYPQEKKISEAYEMLQKVGLKYEPPKRSAIGNLANKTITSNHFDQIPKELLLSTNPRDVEAANLLIERIIINDERKVKLKTEIKETIDKSMECTNVLNEMLKQFQEIDNEDKKLTIKELYRSCKQLKGTISRLINDESGSAELIGDILAANDALGAVCALYLSVRIENDSRASPSDNQLLTTQSTTSTTNSEILNSLFATTSISSNLPTPSSASNVNEIIEDDIFGLPETSAAEELNILQPIIATNDIVKDSSYQESETNSDIKNNDLLEMCLSPTETTPDKRLNFDQDVKSMVERLKLETTTKTNLGELIEHDTSNKTELEVEKIDDLATTENDCNLFLTSDNTDFPSLGQPSDITKDVINIDELPLSRLTIDIDAIQPGTEQPRVIYSEPDGLKIVFHFAKDKPRSDVQVIVINTTNFNGNSILKYNFDAIVSKPCKLFLLKASGDRLSGCKPFRSPTEYITQVLLISNKNKTSFSLTCIASYYIENEPDLVREPITVENLPYLELFFQDIYSTSD